ncbi:MAG: multiheme c-type cytochrome [Campylobacterota bacterium]|nr:multiheme c-type cytochrome [Campylobacterota bacterium]
MKNILLLSVLSVLIYAHPTFEPSQTCKSCHPTIYEEFESTQHAKASIFDDEIHAAVWKKHPKNTKMSSYACAKCHTPSASNYDALMKKHNGVVPDANDTTQREGISCAYCHRIESIEQGHMSNTNIIAKEGKVYFGSLKSHIASPFHKIKTDSKHFNSGNVCVGCHSHKKNKYDINVCSTNIDNELDGSNCVSCHMPKIKGSVSTMNKTKEHTFHGFPGTHAHQDMLTQYVDIILKRHKRTFDITIDNKSSHALALHPMRVMQLRVKIMRKSKVIDLAVKNFARVIGAEGKGTPPWLANEVVQDTAVKANEKRVVTFNEVLEKGDVLEVTIGYFLVNPKMLKSLDLEKSQIATKFHHFKTEEFEIK